MNTPTRRGPYFLNGLAQLKDGATRQTALAELDSIFWPFNRSTLPGNLMALLPIREFLVGEIKPVLWILLGGSDIHSRSPRRKN